MGAPGLGRSFQAGELHLVSLKCQNQIRCQITLKSGLCCVPGHCLEMENMALGFLLKMASCMWIICKGPL